MRARHQGWSSVALGLFLTIALVSGAIPVHAQTTVGQKESLSPNISLTDHTIKIQTMKLNEAGDPLTGVKYPIGDTPDPEMDKLYSNSPWIKISAQFKTVYKLTPTATFTFYVEAYDPLQTDETKPDTYMTLDYRVGKAKFVVLKGETTLLNIPAGDKHVVAMYIHPAMVNRYGGHDGRGDDIAGPLKKNNVRIEVTDGTGDVIPIEYKPKEGDPDWVKHGTATIDHGLLNVMETPFWPFTFRQYNQILPPSSK